MQRILDRRKPKTLAELSTKRYNKEIGFDGYDPVEKTIDGHYVYYNKYKAEASDFDDNGNRTGENAAHKELRQYRNSIPRQVLSFFFGNFMAKRRDTKHLGRTLLWNVLWKPEADAPTGLKAVQYIGMTLGLITFITPLWFLYSLAKNIVLNTAKVVGQYLPGLAIDGFSELQKRIQDKIEHDKVNAPMQFLLEVADVALSVLKAPFEVIHFVVSATLSPIFIPGLTMKASDHARLMYKKAGMIGAIASVFTTMVMWAILFPILATAIVQLALPFLSSHAPQWLVAAGQAISKTLSPVYQAVHNWLSVNLSGLWTIIIRHNPASMLNLLASFAVLKFNAFTSLMGLTVSAKLIAFGAFLASVVTIVGSPLGRLAQYVRNKLNNLGAEPIALPAAIPVGRPAPGSKAELRANLNALTQNIITTTAKVVRMDQALAGKADAAPTQAALDSKADNNHVNALTEQVQIVNDSMEKTVEVANAALAKANAAHDKAAVAQSATQEVEKTLTDQANAHQELVAGSKALEGRVENLEKGNADAIGKFGIMANKFDAVANYAKALKAANNRDDAGIASDELVTALTPQQ